MREGFDVLDERGPSIDAALKRPRRNVRGPRVAFVDVVDCGRLLAGDIRVWRRHDPHSGSPTDATALGDRSLHCAQGLSVDCADVQHDLIGTNRFGGNLGTVENEMWSERHHSPVLGAQWLTFRTIDQHSRVTGGALGHRTPLGSYRKCRAAAPAEATLVDLSDESARPTRQGAETRRVLAKCFGPRFRRGAVEDPRSNHRRWPRDSDESEAPTDLDA